MSLIVGGYLALIVMFGWPGLVAGAIHVGVMLLATGKPKR